MPRRVPRIQQLRASRFQAAVQSDASHPDTDELVGVARSLAPGMEVRADKQAERRAHMLATAREAFTATTETPGVSGAPVHSARVETPDGEVHLADVEHLTPERVDQIVRAVTDADRTARQ